MSIRFHPPAACALLPRAFGAELPSTPVAANARVGDVAIVSVRGPLMHHRDPALDSYEAIRGRVAEALAGKPRAVVLLVDSPGGLVSGMLETAEALRAACKAAGVPLLAHVDGMACSAAYALTCAASKVSAASTATVGSIGVLDALVDATARDAAYGLRFSLVASGPRKMDGNEHVATTDPARLAVQARVDTLAGIFFAHVAKARGIAAPAVAAQGAAIFVGAAAKAAGLVDVVGSLDELLASVSKPTAAPTAPAKAAPKASPQPTPQPRKEAAAMNPIQKEIADLRASQKSIAESRAFDPATTRAMLAVLEDRVVALEGRAPAAAPAVERGLDPVAKAALRARMGVDDANAFDVRLDAGGSVLVLQGARPAKVEPVVARSSAPAAMPASRLPKHEGDALRARMGLGRRGPSVTSTPHSLILRS